MVLINECIVLTRVFHFAKGLRCSADCVCVAVLIVCSVLKNRALFVLKTVIYLVYYDIYYYKLNYLFTILYFEYLFGVFHSVISTLNTIFFFVFNGN